jgi:hypothetical protein
MTTPDAQIVGRLTFEPVPEGTRLNWVRQVRPTGTLGLTSSLSAFRMARRERAIWAGLKTSLEFSARVPGMGAEAAAPAG